MLNPEIGARSPSSIRLGSPNIQHFGYLILINLKIPQKLPSTSSGFYKSGVRFYLPKILLFQNHIIQPTTIFHQKSVVNLNTNRDEHTNFNRQSTSLPKCYVSSLTCKVLWPREKRRYRVYKILKPNLFMHFTGSYMKCVFFYDILRPRLFVS